MGSYLAMSGATLREIMEILGHTQPEMAARYSHLTVEHLRGIVERTQTKYPALFDTEMVAQLEQSAKELSPPSTIPSPTQERHGRAIQRPETGQAPVATTATVTLIERPRVVVRKRAEVEARELTQCEKPTQFGSIDRRR